MQPPIPYFGSKASIAQRVAQLFPDHGHYIEPYAGSLAVLLAKSPILQETVNDLDQQIVNFWRVLRDRPADLERACALTPHSRAEQLAAHQAIPADELESAVATWTRLTQSIGANPGKNTGWRHYHSPHRDGSLAKRHMPAWCARIAPAAQRLKGVSLECRPALDVIRDYGRPGALIYADPPYLPSVLSTQADYPAAPMTVDDHTEMLDALTRTQAFVAISGYDSDQYTRTLAGWWRTEIPARAGNANRGRRAQRRTEIVWTNYEPPYHQPTLMERAEI
jgi:DNA adenine methylase